MDDDSCVMKYIEIVPLTNSTDIPEHPDIKHPVQVKVCTFVLDVTYFLDFRYSFVFTALVLSVL